MAGRFDFISGDDFRASLESDYAELDTAMQSGSWKSAMVLAGSIVEAVLVDYLVSTNYSISDPLQMTLAQATVACKQAGALSQQASELTTVIRGYRNLIHPGRVIRLGESISEDGARIARSLVDMVIHDVSNNIFRRHGRTAEDIMRKIKTDPTSHEIIRQLIRDSVDFQLDRLLLAIETLSIDSQRADYVRTTHSGENYASFDSLGPSAKNRVIRSIYFEAYNCASQSVKIKASERFLQRIKYSTAALVRVCESALFCTLQLRYMGESDAAMVKSHFLEALASRPTSDLISSMYGIAPYLLRSDIVKWAISCANQMEGEVRDSFLRQMKWQKDQTALKSQHPELSRYIRRKISEVLGETN